MVMAVVVETEISQKLGKSPTRNSGDKKFSIQWHITAECDQSCIHCYAKDERTYRNELEHPLSVDECKKVIDGLITFSKKIEAKPSIVFTGGDPLLRRDFFDIARYAKEQGTLLSILGNPYHLDEENLIKLKNLKIKSYQISIDGLQETHDYFRKPGSFDRSIKALQELQKYGIRTVVMFTISKQNANDLIPVMRLVSNIGVDAFAFARVCGFGDGKSLETFTSEEYRDILLKAYEEEKHLKAKGSKTLFNKKDHLYTLLLTELGESSYELPEDKVIYGGCSIGCRSFCILADGTAFACRRFYSPIGKVPEQSIEEIFISEELNKYRNTDYEKCSKCNLLQYCRGCPAVAYGETGIFGSADPHCWKIISPK